MKIIFSDRFYGSDYANDAASVSGRLEMITESLSQDASMQFILPRPAEESEILLAHTAEHLSEAKMNPESFQMAMLAAGAAVVAAETAMRDEPAFACVRPPGHHASRASSWGYCVFCNMGVALQVLRSRGQIKSAMLLDFDAHTGDGTIDVLAEWRECQILNPYRDSAAEYLQEIQDFIRPIQAVDVVAICAGFDTYEKDVGRKLSTFDFYQIGFFMKKFAQRAANGRRFAVLEGGYYLPDLGKNVLAFCQGFQ